MKKILYIVIAALFVLNFAYALPTNPELKVSLINQEPDPVAPGQYVTLRFKIENFGNEALQDFYVKLIPKFPFIQDGADKNEKFLGTLWGGLSGDYGVVVSYKVRVSDNAVTGNMPITIAYKYSGSDVWTQMDFNVHIRVVYNQIFVENIQQKPSVVKPGGNAVLSFKLKNYGDTTMHDITLMLGLQGAEIPLVPVGELSEKRIRVLKPGEEESVSFRIKADPDAQAKLYKVGITLTYYDILNNKFTYSDVVGIPVGSKPALMVALEKSSVYVPGDTGDVVVDLVNRGETSVKFLSVMFHDGADFRIIEGKKQYIGNLDSDDFDTAKIRIHINENATSLRLPLTVEYKDALGNFYSENMSVKLPIYSKAEAIKYGFIKRSNTVGIVITVLIILSGFVVFKALKRK